MTKLATALLLAENKKKTDIIKYTQSAKNQPEFSLDINVKRMNIGETMTAEDVMKALLMFSANDSAYMIADSVAGDATAFGKMMNDRIQKIGMKNSNFFIPNGLHDPNHYTTPYDMTLLMREAIKNPWVKEVMGTKKDTIHFSDGKTAIVENRNKNLGVDGNIAGKTGYTAPAGRCLVAVYERDGRSIVGVVMRAAYDNNDVTVFNDMKKIIDWSYKAKQTQLVAKDTVVETQDITYKPFKFFGPEKTIQVPIILKDEISYYENDINKKELKQEKSVEPLDAWKLSTETKVGTYTVKQREYTKTYDLYPTVDSKQIYEANKGLYFFTGTAVFIVFIVLVLIIVLIARKAGRKGYRYR